MLHVHVPWICSEASLVPRPTPIYSAHWCGRVARGNRKIWYYPSHDWCRSGGRVGPNHKWVYNWLTNLCRLFGSFDKLWSVRTEPTGWWTASGPDETTTGPALPTSTSHQPDDTHVMNARPSPFFAALPHPCIIVNANWWIENGVDLGTRLLWGIAGVTNFIYSSGQKKVPVPFQNYERNTLDSNKDKATERKSSIITETLCSCVRALP